MEWLKGHGFQIVAGAFAAIAIFDHPYSYYQITRWIVCAVAIYAAYQAYQAGKAAWPWIFGVVAVLFNPLFPFYFAKGTWQVLDAIVAAIFFVSLFTKASKE